jgi:AcrR family transcriptional regulator
VLQIQHTVVYSILLTAGDKFNQQKSESVGFATERAIVMEKSEESEDRRVQRTRKQIQEAFVALTVEMGFTAVTVRHITERADINRSTFYRYYADKYRLLEALTAPELTEEGHETSEGETRDPGPVRLLRHVQSYADFYRVMLGVNGDPAFTDRFRQNTARRFRSWVQGNPEPAMNGAPLDMRINYIAYAGVGAIVWWLEHGQEISPEQFAGWLSSISTSIVGPFVKEKWKGTMSQSDGGSGLIG